MFEMSVDVLGHLCKVGRAAELAVLPAVRPAGEAAVEPAFPSRDVGGAEACHFFILAHTYLYRQREDLAMGLQLYRFSASCFQSKMNEFCLEFAIRSWYQS